MTRKNTASRTTVFERVGAAMQSSDLSSSAYRLRDVDFVAALGMVGQQTTVPAVMRLDATMDARDCGGAFAACKSITQKLGKERSWVLTSSKIARVAKLALRTYLRPTCTTCHGRGRIGMAKDGGLVLVGSIRPCARCGGSGQEPIRGPFADEVRAVVAYLEQRRTEVLAGVARKVRVGGELE